MRNFNTSFGPLQPVAGKNDAGGAGAWGVSRERGVPTRTGLSMAHISPHASLYGHVDFYLGGTAVAVRRPVLFLAGQYGGGRRGDISRFTAASRRRMMQKIGRISKAVLPLFVTLTYPAEFPAARCTKRHLDNFWKRVKRSFPGAAAVWKLEAQKRGAPHYHLMFWGVSKLDLIRFISVAWYEVVGSGDEKHLRAGTQVQQVHTWGGVMSYAAKYIGKIEDLEGSEWVNPGRFWGVLGRDCVPWAELVRCTVTDREAVQLIRYLRRCCHIKSRAYRSLSLNVGNSEYWFDRLDQLIT